MADVTWLIGSTAIMALIILIGISVIWKTFREKKSGFPIADERTQKINGKAAYYALFMGQYFIIAILMVMLVGREFLGMPEIEAGYPLIASVLVSSLSYIVLRWYLGRKGEF